MTPSAEQLAAWLVDAERIARTAGASLAENGRRLGDLRTEFKGRRDLVTEADRQAERLVVEGVRQHFGGHAILAEEGVLTPAGVADRASDYVWMVDPLDGTTNFVHGIPFYCVAMALVYRGEPLLGVVHAPALGDTYTASRGGGARCNGRPLRVSTTTELDQALLATGFSYHRNEPGFEDNTARITAVATLCRDLRRLGSAELDLCLTARGSFDGYWEMYLQPYDLAAGGVVVREAGGRVTDLGGGDAWVEQGHVVASNGLIHARLLDVVGGVPGSRL